MLNIQGKKCLVVGGGKVACRKILSLLECNAAVTVIAPEACDAILLLRQQRRINLIRRNYQIGDVKRHFLVIAASNCGAVNEGVAREAQEEGVLVNVVDHRELSTFIVPSVLRRGDLTVAVGTKGKSPLLAKLLKEELEGLLPKEYGDLLEKLGEARENLKKRDLSPRGKRQYYQEIINNSGLM